MKPVLYFITSILFSLLFTQCKLSYKAKLKVEWSDDTTTLIHRFVNARATGFDDFCYPGDEYFADHADRLYREQFNGFFQQLMKGDTIYICEYFHSHNSGSTSLFFFSRTNLKVGGDFNGELSPVSFKFSPADSIFVNEIRKNPKSFNNLLKGSDDAGYSTYFYSRVSRKGKKIKVKTVFSGTYPHIKSWPQAYPGEEYMQWGKF